jgi:hypothetical protein
MSPSAFFHIHFALCFPRRRSIDPAGYGSQLWSLFPILHCLTLVEWHPPLIDQDRSPQPTNSCGVAANDGRSKHSASMKPSQHRKSESSLVSQHFARAYHDRKWHEITIVGSQPPERVCLLPHFVYAVLLQCAARQDVGSPPAVLAVDVSQPVSVLGLCVQGSRVCGKVSRFLRLSAWL